MKKNIIFTAIILIFCFITIALIQANQTEGNYAVINIVDSESITLELNENKIHYFTTQTGSMLDFTIEVSDNKARFINSVCPDHLCENYNWLSHSFDEAICAPAGVVLNISEFE